MRAVWKIGDHVKSTEAERYAFIGDVVVVYKQGNVMFFDKLKYVAVAAVISITPFAASAATVVIDGGGPYDVLADSYVFEKDFDPGALGETLTFVFQNTSLATQVVGVSVATINQLTAYFTDGVTAEWLSGQSHFTAQGVFDAFQINTVLAAGASDTLQFTFGNVVDAPTNGDGIANIDFQVVAAVPVPAAGFLLFGALGGLAALRRRKSTAA